MSTTHKVKHTLTHEVEGEFAVGDMILHTALSDHRIDCVRNVRGVIWQGGGAAYLLDNGSFIPFRKEKYYRKVEV